MSYAWRIEAGQVTTLDTATTPSFTNVTFQNAFDVIPIVVVLPSNEGTDPAMLRIRNVSLTGFDVTTAEPRDRDGTHPGMTIHYMAIEPGVHSFPNGTQIAANRHTTSSWQSKLVGPTGWDTVSFGTTFSTTASVVATIQSLNSETGALPTTPTTPTTPLLSVTTRNPGTASIQMALERSEDTQGTVIAEDIGWVAFPRGSGNFDDILDNSIGWDARTSADNVTGNCRVTTFTTVSWPNARIFATKNRRDGVDGGWTRRCSLTATTVGLRIQEDTLNDTETNHTNEAISLLSFSDSFHAEFSGRIEANKEVALASGTYALPGNSVRYTISAQSTGNLPIDLNEITLVDRIPPDLALKVMDIGTAGSGPVNFIQGTPASTLTYTFTNLADLSDDVDFSNDGGLSFTYTPTANGMGADPTVTNIRITPKGTFLAASPSGPPSFSVEFDAVIK